MRSAHRPSGTVLDPSLPTGFSVPVLLVSAVAALSYFPGTAVAQEESCVVGGIVEGRVLDTETGVALPGARVTVRPAREGMEGDRPSAVEEGLFETEASSDGSYRLCGLPFGRWLRVRAILSGRESEPAEIRLVPGRPHTRDLAVPLGGRGPGRVVGRVTDRETHRPVTAATVSLGPLDLPTGGTARASRVPSDGQGRFVLEDLPPGRYRLEITHMGYGPATEEVTVPPNRTVEVNAELAADPVELEPIVATAVRNPMLETRGFYERKQWGERLGLGHFFTREDIERRRPQRLSHMVGDLPGVRLWCGKSFSCKVFFTRSPPRCDGANVYLDGIKIADADGNKRGGMPLDEAALPVEVAAVEVYKGAASLPGSFGGAAGQCGAVVVWTRFGHEEP